MSDLDGFATIPRWIQRSTEVSAHAKLVYLALSSRVNRRQEAWPSHELLAEEASCSVASVQRALRELRALGVVDWQLRTSGRNGRTSNRYRLLNAPPEPDEVPVTVSTNQSTKSTISDEVPVSVTGTDRSHRPRNESQLNESHYDDVVDSGGTGQIPGLEDDSVLVVQAFRAARLQLGDTARNVRVTEKWRTSAVALLKVADLDQLLAAIAWTLDAGNEDAWWRDHVRTLLQFEEQWPRIRSRVPAPATRDWKIDLIELAGVRELDFDGGSWAERQAIVARAKAAGWRAPSGWTLT